MTRKATVYFQKGRCQRLAAARCRLHMQSYFRTLPSHWGSMPYLQQALYLRLATCGPSDDCKTLRLPQLPREFQQRASIRNDDFLAQYHAGFLVYIALDS